MLCFPCSPRSVTYPFIQLGRGDTNKTMANVFDFIAKRINYTNTNTTRAHEPLTNLTGIFPGPLNPTAWIPFTAPTNSSLFGTTFFGPGVNTSLSTSTVSKIKPLNLSFAEMPSSGVGNITYSTPLFGSTGNGTIPGAGNGSSTNSTGSESGSKGGAAGRRVSAVMVDGSILAGGLMVVGLML